MLPHIGTSTHGDATATEPNHSSAQTDGRYGTPSVYAPTDDDHEPSIDGSINGGRDTPDFDFEDGHLNVMDAKKALITYLTQFISEGDAQTIVDSKLYNPQIIRAIVARIEANALDDQEQLHHQKEVKIPSINPYKCGSYTISDLPLEQYSTLSPLMGMIVNCCAVLGGSGSHLCEASENSAYFKILIIHNNEGFITALTVVCEGTNDAGEKSLIILGLESRNGAAIEYRTLIEDAAEQMLSMGCGKYKDVLFAAAGEGLYRTSIIDKKTLNDALSTKKYKPLRILLDKIFQSQKNDVIPTKRKRFDGSEDSSNDLIITDGAKYRMPTLSRVPEAAICVRVRKYSAIDDIKRFMSSIVNELSVAATATATATATAVHSSAQHQLQHAALSSSASATMIVHPHQTERTRDDANDILRQKQPLSLSNV